MTENTDDGLTIELDHHYGTHFEWDIRRQEYLFVVVVSNRENKMVWKHTYNEKPTPEVCKKVLLGHIADFIDDKL